jgi:hypothetical protein
MAKAKVKIPREVAGVKVPKGLRKEAKRALKLADSAAVRELAVSGLAIAAQALLDKAQSQRAATRAAAAEAVDQGRRQATAALKANLDALHLGDVLRAAAMEGARRFLEGFEEGQREAPAPKPAAPARPAAAKPAKAKAAPTKPRAKAKPAPARGKKAAARPGASAST